NVEVTEELVRQAAVAGVSRFVHVSTIAAYGPPDRLLMDESHPVDPQQSSTYGRTKAEGELRAFQVAAEVGLPLTVIRPGMVYGPRSPGWTVRMLKLVQSRTPVVFGEGDGHAHPVFIDNLVDGLLLAATRPEAIGQAFNFVDAAITWRAFFDYYGAMAGRKSVRLPLWLARVGLAVYKLVSGRQESGQELLNYYTMKAVYPTGKAEQLLGYRPRVSLAEGMALAERWLREQGYL
ncbi:MAG: NAD-dependent epimerase/dehydratase family protein, partial [Chloroflexota bacterium]